MKKQYKELFKNTGAFAISNFSSKVLVFLLVPLYTRVLTTAEYGYYDLTYTTMQLCFPVLTLGITEAVMIFLLTEDSKPDKIFSIAAEHLLISSTAFLIGLLANYIFGFSELTKKYSIYLFLFFVFYCLENVLLQFAKGINHVNDMAVAGVLGTMAMVLFNVLFLLVFRWGLKGYYVANILGYFVPCIYIAIRLRLSQYVNIVIDRVLQKSMVAYAAPLIINTLGWWVNNTSDRYIVSSICGVSSNGLISVAYKIPNILSNIAGIFIQAWQISVIKEKNSNEQSSLYSVFFVHYNAVLCFFASFLILFDKVIARFAFGNDFFVAWQYVPFLIISSLLNSVAGYMGAILAADMNSKALAKSASYSIVINVLLNIILTLLIGPQGITIATMIGSFVIYYNREKSSKGVIRGAKYRAVLFSWCILVLMSIAIIYWNNYIIAIALTIVELLIYRDSIKSVLEVFTKKNFR